MQGSVATVTEVKKLVGVGGPLETPSALVSQGHRDPTPPSTQHIGHKQSVQNPTEN